MRRYSTPQFKFRLTGNDIESLLAGKCYLSFGKWDELTESYKRLFDADYEVEKEDDDTLLITTTLTQEQTAQYLPNAYAYVQFRSVNDTNSVVTSMAMVRVLPTLKDEIISTSDFVYDNTLTFNDDGSVTGERLMTIPDYDTITSIDLPVCTSVGNYAFQNCSALTSIDLPECTTVGADAFYSCSKLTSIDLPECTSVGDSVFYICTALTSIDLPVCTSVGDRAFYSCTKLTSANLPECTSVGDRAFYNCSSLTSANLPVCTSVGYGAFEGCSALTSANLPVCTSVGDRAFYSCTKLTTVILRSTTRATLSSTSAFSGCSALTGIYVPDSLVSQYKAATNWSTYAAKIKPLSELPS